MTADLVAFLRERLDEDAASIERNLDGRGLSEGYPQYPAYADGDTEAADEFLARFSPARMLAEIDAKRRMIEEQWGGPDHHDMWDHHLHLLALPYANHPDYRPEWAPAT